MIFTIKLFFELNNLTQLVILIIGIISLSYPYVIRRIPYIKVFVIAFVWTIASCIIEGLENNIGIDQVIFDKEINKSHIAKAFALLNSPYEKTIFLDTDTFIHRKTINLLLIIIIK